MTKALVQYWPRYLVVGGARVEGQHGRSHTLFKGVQLNDDPCELPEDEMFLKCYNFASSFNGEPSSYVQCLGAHMESNPDTSVTRP
jgi:hypothetical protein